jgi:hypothetical protein
MKAENDVSRTTLGTVPGTVQEVILGGSPKPVFPRISAPIPGARRTATLGPNCEGTGKVIVWPILASTCLPSLRASTAVIRWATRDSVCRVVCRTSSTASCGMSSVGENGGQSLRVAQGPAKGRSPFSSWRGTSAGLWLSCLCGRTKAQAIRSPASRVVVRMAPAVPFPAVRRTAV